MQQDESLDEVEILYAGVSHRFVPVELGALFWQRHHDSGRTRNQLGDEHVGSIGDGGHDENERHRGERQRQITRSARRRCSSRFAADVLEAANDGLDIAASARDQHAGPGLDTGSGAREAQEVGARVDAQVDMRGAAEPIDAADADVTLARDGGVTRPAQLASHHLRDGLTDSRTSAAPAFNAAHPLFTGAEVSAQKSDT